MDLKLKELAELLQVSEKTIYRWIDAGKIPYYRLGHQYRFRRDEIDQWVMKSDLSSVPSISSPLEVDLPLSNYMSNGGIYYNIAGDSVRDLLRDCLRFVNLRSPLSSEKLLDLLVHREEMASTAIGHGVAIPHPREMIIEDPNNETMLLCLTHEPLDYNALDGQPVHSLFLVFSADPTRHLRLLSQISHLCREKRFIESLERNALRDEITAFMSKHRLA